MYQCAIAEVGCDERALLGLSFVRESLSDEDQFKLCVLLILLYCCDYVLLEIALLMFCLLGGCVADFSYCIRTALVIHLHGWLK